MRGMRAIARWYRRMGYQYLGTIVRFRAFWSAPGMPDREHLTVDRSKPTSFDREALGAVKAQINLQGVPRGAEIEASYGVYSSAAASCRVQARRAKAYGLGYGTRSDFELNFGRLLPSLDPDRF
jgi:hypothetical protein